MGYTCVCWRKNRKYFTGIVLNSLREFSYEKVLKIVIILFLILNYSNGLNFLV